MNGAFIYVYELEVHEFNISPHITLTSNATQFGAEFVAHSEGLGKKSYAQFYVPKFPFTHSLIGL